MPTDYSDPNKPFLSCHTCGGQCCRYFALQLDRPRSLEDFDNLRWYLAHSNVAIFIEDKDWYLQINNRCLYLAEDGNCTMYHYRPKICRDYGWDKSGETECHGKDGIASHDHFFTTLEELEAYLLKKGKRWASISKEAFDALRRKK
jgi:Fe-S-cluster containining protein